MISDSDIIDQVNPFLEEPSGTWSKPYTFALSTEGVEEKPMWEEETNKDSCAVAATAGDNQIAWCTESSRVPNCPLHRNIEPTQRVDKDIEYPEDPGLVKPQKVERKRNVPLFIVLLLLILVLFIASQDF